MRRTRSASGRCAIDRYDGVPENGFWLPSSPSSTPIARGATTGRIGTPAAVASSA